MRRTVPLVAVPALLLALTGLSVPVAGPASARPAPQPPASLAALSPESATPASLRPQAVPLEGPSRIAGDQREKALGKGWKASKDVAWTTSGDGSGYHVLVAAERDGYAWRTVATLAEPTVQADSWIGNACLTGNGRHVAVSYAPRTATNKPELFDRGAFAALVRLSDGAVTKLPLTSTLAYFSPSCGTGSTVLFTQFRSETDSAADAQTRVTSVDAATGKVAAAVTVPGELTSAVPTPDGIVAADANAVVRLERSGQRRILAVDEATPFRLAPDSAGGVVYMSRKGETGFVRRIASAKGRQTASTLGSGRLDRIGLTRAAQGRVYLTGEVTATAEAMPASVGVLTGSTANATVSSHGRLRLDEVRRADQPALSAQGDPTQLERPVRIRATALSTKASVAFVVEPDSAARAATLAKHPALKEAPADGAASPGRVGPMATPTPTQSGSPSNPVEAERYCSVPRNDVRNQVLQPKPRQVEWAVDQAVRGALTVSRPANWNASGMPAYTPQGLFPPVALSGGGNIPAQVMLGIIAQESNMWQAPGSTVPGVYGNPLIGNYYGVEIYDSTSSNDWDIKFDDADCGYGVTQMTDGMRMAGRTKPGETALPYQTQRAVALDFAANVAAGVQLLQKKWNQTRAAGMTINNGDASKIENWFYAVWAYNSGFYPQSTASSNNGAWGVGWLNNPVNPKYPANRTAFLDITYADAADPEFWPYPEKVMGWAGHPVEVLEAPGTLVAGFRAAWWNDVASRTAVKPPVTKFCDSTNSCVPGAKYTPNDPEVVGAPAGPCAHKNAAGQYDLKCWYNKPATWKSDCTYSCGNELLRFSVGYAYQTDGTAYPPNCSLNGLPSGALVIDDQTDTAPIVRPGCTRNFTNQGTFSLKFSADANGEYPSKTDFHQLGAGFSGHFWFTHTRVAALRGGSMNITGTWTLNRSLTQWARVFVHIPDHGAHTQQARYTVHLGNGQKTRVLLQRVQKNTWVSLGSFPFSGTPKVSLGSSTYDGDDGVKAIENEDIAWDAVAFQPLTRKPSHIVVSLGDSYSSGEGGSAADGSDYYPETDNNGKKPTARNGCHRSRYTWSRRATIAGTSAAIGTHSDTFNTTVEHHLLACSGAQTENLLPYYTVPSGASKPANAFGQTGVGQYGELSQLDKGFLDENTTLVTLSIGGNDSRFGDVVAECIIMAGLKLCQDAQLPGSSIPAGEEVPALINGKVKTSIIQVLGEIRKKAPNAKVLLMGYPRLLEALGQCQVGIGTEEAPWLNKMADTLATAMNDAVRQANAKVTTPYAWFSDPRTFFDGKAVCGNPETVHGVIAPWNRTPGEDLNNEIGTSQQSFHPKIDGYGLYADSMNATLRKMGL